ncbi:MAG: ribosome silencing factor [Bryobacterales bacterium]|nr:ribosome silencing factor [Acidobacteriota bacterium]MCB9383375.1 ribosome silencing factor [Bryobacterales bacterium]
MEPWQIAVEAARSKKAEDIVVLDIGKVSSFTEFFVICTGTNTRQTQAIADAVQEQMRAAGWRPMGVEGEQRGEWVLVDYGDLLIHVFTPDKRAFYDLERLWSKAPRVPIPEEAPVEG